jgi:hypothetical protein
VSGQLHAPDRFTSRGNNPWYPLDRTLCVPLNRFGRGGDGLKTGLDSRASKQVSVLDISVPVIKISFTLIE